MKDVTSNNENTIKNPDGICVFLDDLINKKQVLAYLNKYKNMYFVFTWLGISRIILSYLTPFIRTYKIKLKGFYFRIKMWCCNLENTFSRTMS